MGTPQVDTLSYKIDEKTKMYLSTLPNRNKIDWKILFPNSNSIGLDLLDKMLNYDPVNRFTAYQCLVHPYFLKYTSNKEFHPEKCQ